jgi:hypothetical protein
MSKSLGNWPRKRKKRPKRKQQSRKKWKKFWEQCEQQKRKLKMRLKWKNRGVPRSERSEIKLKTCPTWQVKGGQFGGEMGTVQCFSCSFCVLRELLNVNLGQDGIWSLARVSASLHVKNNFEIFSTFF